jgi:ubiquinone/menaquinone biosynthesis C-methylase UbiE
MRAPLGKQFANYSYQSYSWKFLELPALDRLLKKHIKKGQKVIDAGCGNGRTINYLVGKGINPKDIVGVDISNQLLSIAKKSFPESTFIKADITSWVTSKKFDLVTCIFVLHYFDIYSFRKTLHNFYSYLKKDGILIYMVPHPIRWTKDNLKTYFKRKKRLINVPWGGNIPYNHKTIGDYVNTTIETGFEILKVDECEVMSAGIKDKKNYKKYSAFPSRFAVLARKN